MSSKKAKLVDPLAEVKANPEQVTHVMLNPAATRNAGLGTYDVLPAFPDELFACRNLVELEIFRGIAAHSKIPRELGTLRMLTSLSLGGLGFKMLPDELGDLERLEKLSLSYTESLLGLPSTIGKLKKLRELTIIISGLKAIPAEIGELTELRVLQIDRSPMTTVPVELWRATQLEKLTLPDTVETLPPGIAALTTLTELTISAKALTSIAGELAQLHSLRRLQLTGTANTLPETIGLLRSLEELHAGHLGLKALPPSMAKLGKLAILDVSGNQLATVIGLLAKFPVLGELATGDNPIPVAERRELDRLMKLSPARRAAALAKLPTEKPPRAAKPPAVTKTPRPDMLGQVIGQTAHLTMVLGDARIIATWRGVGDVPEKSDWERARVALAKREAAMIDVGDTSALAMSLGIGQGSVRIYKIADRIIGVESFVVDPDDDLFLEWVASPSAKPRSAAILPVRSGKLAIVPSTESGDEALVVPVAAKVAIAIEAIAKGSWGSARRFFITPA